MRKTPLPCHRWLAGTALAAFAMTAGSPAFAVVPGEDSNADEIVDADDSFRGVGMFFRADGSVCSGTLINPRTVLFAAHCVNDRPATDYNVDDVPAAWSFNVDAFPGFVDWISNNFASNPDLAVFNVNRIFYNERSLDAAFGANFIEADIALASLDTPAAGIPTWALLFSTLPAPTVIDPVRGTSYQVDIVGYGGTGNALEGAVDGIDFRRRAAENMLGGFFSLDDRDDVIFGPDVPTFPQNLYHVDFDSQDRDAPLDFNVNRDDALPGEGISAGGDSGGPLILGAANNSLSNEDLVIGLLSGGSRFFGEDQPFSSLGTSSFYQPLSLYWQYISRTNPYRYVGAKVGNGNWEDPNHWVTLLDPAYRVIDSQGQVVNGLPSTRELGTRGTGGDFGAVCLEFEEPGDTCTDIGTGETVETFAQIAGSNRVATGSHANPAQQARALPLPNPTLANGLPGASRFVPNNIDPIVSADPDLNVNPRYFDVTLSEDGITTLGSTATIDRLTLRGNAGLTVTAAGDLTSLIDVNQLGGRVNVNGGITTGGDYTVFAGMLEGTGTVITPFLTSITGVLSPAAMGTVGTLSIDGNLVMSSGSTFNVDLGTGSRSDRLAVTGIADVGGAVDVGPGVMQRVNGRGEQYTIVTAGDGVSGSFTARSLSAILGQTFLYRPNRVLMEITAASYATVINRADPVQAAYAQLFDQNRSNNALASLYGLDFATADTIRSTFSGLAPVTEQAVLSLAAQSVNLLQNFNDGRLRVADKSRTGGKIAVTGSPLELAQMGLAPGIQPISHAMMGFQDDVVGTPVSGASLPENIGIFLSGGYISGDADSLPGFDRETEVSGLSIAGGIEFYPGDNTMVGLSGYYSAMEADTPLGQRVDSDTYAASLYLRHRLAGGPVIDGQFTMGSIGFDTRRQLQFLGAGQTLRSNSNDLLVSGALGVSYDLESSFGTISPGLEARYASIDLAAVRENGGVAGLSIARETFESTQARAGFDYAKQGKSVLINAVAQLVWELEDGPQLLAANFVQGTGPSATFVLGSADSTWGEVGISAAVGEGPLQLSIGADTTIGRSNADAQVVRGTATYRF